MTRNNLVGTARNLWKFRNIQGLCLLANGRMTGNLSDIVFGNMTRLRQLCVSKSALEGYVPWKALLKLENLEKLQICCTKYGLKGDVPQDIGKLNKLQVLSIGANNIKGPMPKSINNLTKLWFLDLDLIKFTSGDLSYFSNMPNLTYIDITNCGLKGTIPKDFVKTHPLLVELLFKGNMFEGKIEDIIDGLENLQFLFLRNNRIGGLLPRMLSNLTKLKLLDLSHNDFIGLEKNMAFNQNLEYLFLNDNVNLRTDIGTMLRAIEPCKNLHIFNASNCSLQGQFSHNNYPVYLGPITNLDLGTNNLTGSIPSFRTRYFAGELDSLLYLSLASNQLVGNIPNTFLTSLKILNYLDIRHNSNLRAADLRFFQLKLKPNYQVAIRTKPNSNFSCPSFQLFTSSGEVHLDPSYYKYSLCSCDKGFYGYGNSCLPCMRGGLCKKAKKQFPSTAAGDDKLSKDNHLEIKMTIKKGYWPCCQGFGDVQRLIKCEMNEVFQTEVCSPSEDCQCRVAASPYKMQPKTICNSSCICRLGNTGRFCSQCISGYYKKGPGCTKCPTLLEIFPYVTTTFFILCFSLSVVLLTRFRSHKRVTLVVMIFLFVTLAFLDFFSVIPAWFFISIFVTYIVGLTNERAKLQSLIAITVFYFQSLDAILSEAKIWPATVVLLKYKITSVFNFDLAQFTCIYHWSQKPEMSFLVLPVLSIAAVTVVWLLHFVVNAIGRRCIIQRSTCKRTTIHVLLLVYFPITKTTLSAISQCVHRDGLSYLKDTPWLDCDGSSYNTLRIEGYVFLGVFVICIPLCILAPLLYKNLGKNGERLSEATDIWLGPLYNIYCINKYRRYFPHLFLSRRLLLAMSLSLIQGTSSFQILSITVVLVVFVIIDLIARPFKRCSEKFPFENASDILACVVLLLSFVGLATLRSSASTDQAALVWFILCMNFLLAFLCVLGILILLAFSLWRGTQPAPVSLQQYEHIPDGPEDEVE